jgi:hypothetical protein
MRRKNGQIWKASAFSVFRNRKSARLRRRPLHKPRESQVARHATRAARTGSGGGFWAEDARETGAGELDTDNAFAIGERLGHVDDAALSLEFGVAAARNMILGGDANLEIGADGDVEASAKSGAPTAKILAGSVFFERKSSRVATADA